MTVSCSVERKATCKRGPWEACVVPARDELLGLRGAEKRLGISVNVVGQQQAALAASVRVKELQGTLSALHRDSEAQRKILLENEGASIALRPQVAALEIEEKRLTEESARLAWQEKVLAALEQADLCREEMLGRVKEARTLPVSMMPETRRLALEVAAIAHVCAGAGTVATARCDGAMREAQAKALPGVAGVLAYEGVKDPVTRFEVWQEEVTGPCGELRDRLATRLARITQGGNAETKSEREEDEARLARLERAAAGAPATGLQVTLESFRVALAVSITRQKEQKVVLVAAVAALSKNLAETRIRLEEARMKKVQAFCTLFGKKDSEATLAEKCEEQGLTNRITHTTLELRQAQDDHTRMRHADAIIRKPGDCENRFCKCVVVKKVCEHGPCMEGGEL